MAVPRAVAAPLRYFVHRFLTYGWRQESPHLGRQAGFIYQGRQTGLRRGLAPNMEERTGTMARAFADTPPTRCGQPHWPPAVLQQRTFRPVDEQWGRLRGHSTNSAACRQALGGRPPGSAGRARRADQGTAAPARSAPAPRRSAPARRRSAPAPAAARTSLQSNPARSPAPSALPTTGRPAGAGRERRGSSSAPRRSTAARWWTLPAGGIRARLVPCRWRRRA